MGNQCKYPGQDFELNARTLFFRLGRAQKGIHGEGSGQRARALVLTLFTFYKRIQQRNTLCSHREIRT